MSRILIFSGTTEGRELAETLAYSGIKSLICVATEYGTQVMGENEKIEIHQGRLTKNNMIELMKSENFIAVVDATHPFAIEVSKNIRESAEYAKLVYMRLKRDTSFELVNNSFYYSDSKECAEYLVNTEGNILLTTGSKDLEYYCENDQVKDRIFVRVLPGVESIEKCSKAGIVGKQIIALQGPFSEELNRVLYREYNIKHVVTKESGVTGGYPEKVKAAIKEEVTLHIIGNPEKEMGYTFNEIYRRISSLTGKIISEKQNIKIDLIGIGMGNKKGMTVEAGEAFDNADIVFGAKRLLELAKNNQKKFPYYLAEDIIPEIDKIIDKNKDVNIAILFSGDSGFYSGCDKLFNALYQWKNDKKINAKIKIYSGISSISYFSSCIGISWQDAKILSLHGKNNWKKEFIDTIRYNRKTFLLLSGVKTLNDIGKTLIDNKLDCIIKIGYQLSYAEEEIFELSADECLYQNKEGLYVCVIINEKAENKLLTHGKKDKCFIREKVPMTKEEIREIAICKLELHENSIVYDIGSGTGSIAVEIADRSSSVKVYAIEQKENAVDLIKDNCNKFKLENVEVIYSKAPEGFEKLPIPTHAFIGGSSGNLMDILKILRDKNSNMKVVITAISLETISEISDIKNRFSVKDYEVVQVQVSREKRLGNYSLMQAENPVYICSFRFA